MDSRALERELLGEALPKSIGALFHDRVRRTPEREAFVFFDDGVSVTYAELDRMVHRVSAAFTALGVRRSTHVALLLPNVLEFPVTWFALASLGAIAVPLNPKFTARELDYALNDADVDLLVIEEECLPALEAMKERPERLPDSNVIVRTDESSAGRYQTFEDLLAGEPVPFAPSPDVAHNDLVSIQYTSGTTGFPKGCMLDHRYWLQLGILAVALQGGHTPRRVLIQEPLFYMQGNFVMIAALHTNATIYCARRPSIAKFFDWVERYSIDYCGFPVPALRVMDQLPADAGRSLEFVHAWYFHGDDLARLEERFGVVGRDSYGMTENGCCTYVPVDDPTLAASVSVGITAPFRELRIVDESGNDVPDGEVGELWTAGPGTFHGYYRKPRANRESFRGRWFRTGDLFRRDASGAYYLVGRIKDMIKRSGENISAAEVEDRLIAMPEIVMAAVVAVPDATRDQEVKAYVQLRAGLTADDVTPQRIFAHCVEHLASFKIPRYLAYVAEFPMSVAGDKVAKPALIADVADLTAGTYDRIGGIWR